MADFARYLYRGFLIDYFNFFSHSLGTTDAKTVLLQMTLTKTQNTAEKRPSAMALEILIPTSDSRPLLMGNS
jgi:hypothetical protein